MVTPSPSSLMAPVTEFAPPLVRCRICGNLYVCDAEGSLTATEREIARLVRSGLGNKQIAALQHVSCSTVKFHVGNILAKLGKTSRHEL